MIDNFVFNNLPKDYIDAAKIIPIAASMNTSSLCTVRGMVSSVNITQKSLSALVQDDSGKLRVTFYSNNNRFNNYYRITLRKGNVVTLSGKVREGELVHPKIIQGTPDSLKPIYSSDKIKAAKIKKMIDSIDEDPLPQEVLDKRGMPDLKETARMLHFPKDTSEVELARWSMGYRELYVELLKSHDKNQMEGVAFDVDRQKVEALINSFPFTFTPDQQNAVQDVMRDLESARPMRRIIIGDVGAGKTEVAVAAIMACVSAGFRAQYLCPTEILAMQTYKRLARALAGHAYVALYTASEKTKKATPDVFIGTHALLYNNWEDYKIGLVVIDEQHKFGVKQRDKLAFGPECNILEMSATPIPRTYALFVQSIMDVSILNETPFKKDTETELIIDRQQYGKVISVIESEMAKGNQALIVYPSVESEKNGLKPAIKAFEYWAGKYGEGVGLLHGKIKDKESVLRHFSNGDIKLLVSTSAAEVGIDVPRLTACAVTNAERFGLVQLHQIRGRVGRRGDKSYFFMVCKNEASAERLNGLVLYDNGFDLADVDAKNRGVGHLSGEAQSGHFFQFFNIRDLEIVNFVKEDIGIY